MILLSFNRLLGVHVRVSDQMFNHRALTLKEFGGWVTSAAFIVASVGPTSFAFVLLVGRAKRCADFSATLLMAHAIATSAHSGFPTTITWWCVNVLATIGMACVGEALCMRIELQEIALPTVVPPEKHGSNAAVGPVTMQATGESTMDKEDYEQESLLSTQNTEEKP